MPSLVTTSDTDTPLVGAFEVVGLPGCQVKPRGVAQRIHRGMNLRAQAAAAAAEGLAAAPFF